MSHTVLRQRPSHTSLAQRYGESRATDPQQIINVRATQTPAPVFCEKRDSHTEIIRLAKIAAHWIEDEFACCDAVPPRLDHGNSDSSTRVDSAPLRLEEFIEHILQRTLLTKWKTFGALYLLDRLKKHTSGYGNGVPCGHYLFLPAIMLAHKEMDDSPYANKAWAVVAGSRFPLRKVNQLEREMLFSLNFSLWFDSDKLMTFSEGVQRRYRDLGTGSGYKRHAVSLPSSHNSIPTNDLSSTAFASSTQNPYSSKWCGTSVDRHIPVPVSSLTRSPFHQSQAAVVASNQSARVREPAFVSEPRPSWSTPSPIGTPAFPTKLSGVVPNAVPVRAPPSRRPSPLTSQAPVIPPPPVGYKRSQVSASDWSLRRLPTSDSDSPPFIPPRYGPGEPLLATSGSGSTRPSVTRVERGATGSGRSTTFVTAPQLLRPETRRPMTGPSPFSGHRVKAIPAPPETHNAHSRFESSASRSIPSRSKSAGPHLESPRHSASSSQPTYAVIQASVWGTSPSGLDSRRPTATRSSSRSGQYAGMTESRSSSSNAAIRPKPSIYAPPAATKAVSSASEYAAAPRTTQYKSVPVVVAPVQQVNARCGQHVVSSFTYVQPGIFQGFCNPSQAVW